MLDSPLSETNFKLISTNGRYSIQKQSGNDTTLIFFNTKLNIHSIADNKKKLNF